MNNFIKKHNILFKVIPIFLILVLAWSLVYYFDNSTTTPTPIIISTTTPTITTIMKITPTVIIIEKSHIITVDDNETMVNFYKNGKFFDETYKVGLATRYLDKSKLNNKKLSDKSIEYTGFDFGIEKDSNFVELGSRKDLPDEVIFSFPEIIGRPKKIWIAADSALSFGNKGQIIGKVSIICKDNYSITFNLELGKNIADWRNGKGAITDYPKRSFLYSGFGAANNDPISQTYLSIIPFSVNDFSDKCPEPLSKVSISASNNIQLNITAIMIVAEEIQQ